MAAAFHPGLDLDELRPYPVRPADRLGPNDPTRRLPNYAARRVTVLALLCLLVLAAIRFAAADLGGGPRPAPEVPLARAAGATVVIVQPGDTLWSIARGLQPAGDVRALVDRLAELNGGASLDVGQRLVLP